MHGVNKVIVRPELGRWLHAAGMMGWERGPWVNRLTLR